MHIISLPWGNQEMIDLPLPEEWHYAGEMMPEQAPAIQNVEEELQQALDHPIDHAGFREMSFTGKKVAIVVDDSSRPTPVAVLFPVILKRLLDAGVKRSDILVIIALGTHRAMSSGEIRERLGTDLNMLKIINHNCRDHNCLAKIGKTSYGTEVYLNRDLCQADITISIGTIEPHLIAGFGGGLKNIVPGCAGLATIASTHLRVDPLTRFESVGKESTYCETRKDLEEGASLLQTDYFIVNTVLTHEGNVAGIFCGDPITAHRKGCALTTRVYGAPVGERSDVLLLASRPMDIDLRQGSKVFANALGAASKDALIIAILRCFQGVGDMAISSAFLTVDDTRFFAQKLLTEDFVRLRECAAGQPMDMDDKYMNQYLCEMTRMHHILVYAPELPPDLGDRLGYFELFSDIGALMRRAQVIKPTARRVISSPLGGVCFPILLKNEQ